MAVRFSALYPLVPGLLFAVSAVTLCLAFFVPVYTDEIQFPAISARVGYDGWRTIIAYPLCSNGFGSAVPWPLFPGRVLAWLFYLPAYNPVTTRLMGMGIFVVLLGVFAAFGSRSLRVPAYQLLWMAIALTGIGVLPFMSVLMRPENQISLAIACFALVPFYRQGRMLGERAELALIAAYVLLASWFFSEHQKTFFFFPLVLFCLWQLKRDMLAWKIGFCLVLWMVWEAYFYWQLRTTCPDDYSFQMFFSRIALQPSLLASDPLEFLRRFFIKGVGGEHDYLRSMLFRQRYPSGWLPPVTLPGIALVLNSGIRLLFYGVQAYWLVSVAVIAGRMVRDRDVRDPARAVPLLLLLGMVLTAGFQQEKNFYDVLLLWFCGVLLTAILLVRPPLRLPKTAFKGLLLCLCVFSVLCQLTLIYSFSRLPEINRRAGLSGAMWGQPMSMPVTGYAKRHDHILALAKHCNIDDKDARHLIIDMYTYLPYRQTYRTVLVAHLDNEIIPFAQAYQSDGLVTLCSSLPGNVRARALHHKGVCCLSKDALGKSR